MRIERLYIENIYIPMAGGINPSITKSIMDLTAPDKRESDYSKTITLPRSQEVDKIFSHIFETNLSNGTFNPNTRATCRYEVDDEVIIGGYLKLTAINILDTEDITYKVVIYGTTANFFADIKDLYMNQIDMSDYDHPFTKDIQQKSWATEIIINGSLEPFELGIGYVYPLIDYGLSQDHTSFTFTQIACCLYEHDLMKRLINQAGYTYTSAFLDSDYFKHFIIDSSPDVYNLDSDELEDRSFAANTPELTSTGTTTSNDLVDNVFSTPDTIIFTNELNDSGGNYNPVNGKFTAVNTGIYNVNCIVDVNATFDPSGGAAVKTTCEVVGFIQLWYTPIATGVPVLADSTPFWIAPDDTAFTIGSRSTSSTPTYPSNEYLNNAKYGLIFPFTTSIIPRNVNPPDRYQMSVLGVPLMSGDILEIKWKAKVSSNLPDRFVDVFGTYYGGDINLTIAVGAFYASCANNLMSEGNTLIMSKVLPQKMKQMDYFMSNVKRFNLMIDIDPTNEKNLIIEPRDDFYSQTVLKIHELIDRNKDIEYLPMNILDAKQYYYTYKPDGDYWNKKYTENYSGEVYGDRTINVLTDFVTSLRRTELVFSPTTLVGLPNNNRVLPTILSYDQLNNPISFKHNLRSLYYAGLKPCLNVWKHINYVSVFGIPFPTSYSTYPYAGHFDDPFNPTEDINFGLVKEVFYDGNIDTINVTDNNLWNKYHSKFIQEISDPKSKLVRAYVHLTPVKYKEFAFNKLYFFNESYYRLYKISGYNPTNSESTLCEFLLINDAGVFSPTVHTVDGYPEVFKPRPEDILNADEQVTIVTSPAAKQPSGNNTSNPTQKVQGENNYVNSSSFHVEIYGDENRVFSNSGNIKIHGSGNTIESGVFNVVLINTNDTVVEESNVTYIDGIKVTGDAQSGTYTPTLTGVLNVAASTAYECTYFRVGNVVTVSGQVDIDVTAAGDATLGVSLPIASDLTYAAQLGGTANSGASSQPASISADTTNDRADIYYRASATTNQTFTFIFSYLVA